MRKRILTGVLAALASLTLALPAFAEPPGLSVDTNNGRREARISHPTHDGWYVTLAADNHLLFDEENNNLVAVGAHSRLTKGTGAVRVEVTSIRTRVDMDGNSPDPDLVVDDFFVSASETNRTNTPPNCVEPDTDLVIDPLDVITNLGNTGTYSLYDERAPKDGDCETDADKVKNALNSAFDYSPDVSTVRAYADLIDLDNSGVVSQRTYIRVRWADGSLTAHSLATLQAAYSV